MRTPPASRALHVVNLPVSAVNWTATEKYAESARHTHYMANSAESDYAALAGDVAATLNAIVLASDATGAAEHGGRLRVAGWRRGREIITDIAPTTCTRCWGCWTKRSRA